MGGISTSIVEKDAPYVVLVKDGSDDEYLITRHSQFCIPLNVINWYGEPESHKNNEAVENSWNNIYTDIKRIESMNEGIILIGDLNRHLEN